ncbi:MAG: hypothetical protein B6D64_13445 [Bacteroidetes bacterium 4484_276]|nr:MAG: hypothetical protein B6D64_13445 [Bacteroidetes bacterium 4484_276]
MKFQIFQLLKPNTFSYLFSVVVLLLSITSCEDKVSDFNLEEYPVVEAYLVTGKPVNSIRVFKMNNFTDSIVAGNAISGLQIMLKVDSAEFNLDEKADSSGYYYYAGTGPELLPGAFCQIGFEYNNKVISSETTIPEKPANLELSKTSISVSMGGWGGSGTEPIEVTWDNPGNDYFYMVATNIEENPTPINPELEDQPISVGTSPSTGNLLNIVPRQLRYYGTYELVIFRVNPEFAELSLYTTTNTINLTEPYTNITNGKGIFTAYASDTAYFEAVSK